MAALSWEKPLVQDSRLDMDPLGRKTQQSYLLVQKLLELQTRPQGSFHKGPQPVQREKSVTQ